MEISLVTEIGSWLMLGLGVIGGIVALLTYSRGAEPAQAR